VGPNDANLALLQRLTQGLQGVPSELGKLVHEEDPAVGEGELSRADRSPSADEAHLRRGVMRGSKGWALEQGGRPERARDAVDPGRLQRLLEDEVREQAG
jgi:hypothetical protein